MVMDPSSEKDFIEFGQILRRCYSFFPDLYRVRSTMKAVLTCFFAAMVCTTEALVFPNKALEKVAKAASVASISAAIAMAPLAVNAADFNGAFADPFHPNCQRFISANGAEASLKGTDGTPGCPVDGSGREWQLTGKISGDNILVDFRPKGGPPDLKGTWEDTAPAGIRWPDGNKWTLKAN
jgi:hypothetical protein